MREISVFLFLFFSQAVVQAQKPTKTDSLFHLLSIAKEDSNKVNILLEMANHYEANNQDSSIHYLQLAGQLAKSLDYTKGVYRYFQQSAIVSFTKGQYTKAMEESIQALALGRQLKDSMLVITMLNNTAIIFGYLGKFGEQLNYMLQAKNAIEAVGDSMKFSSVYHNLSNCYNNLRQYRRSITYALLAIEMHAVYNKRNAYINRVYATVAQDYDALQLVDSESLYQGMIRLLKFLSN